MIKLRLERPCHICPHSKPLPFVQWTKLLATMSTQIPAHLRVVYRLSRSVAQEEETSNFMLTPKATCLMILQAPKATCHNFFFLFLHTQLGTLLPPISSLGESKFLNYRAQQERCDFKRRRLGHPSLVPHQFDVRMFGWYTMCMPANYY